jgi:biopolymer transport protein ExbD
MGIVALDERKRVKSTELSFTPLIDCVFLLLLFFMVGVKFKELDRKLDTDLPGGRRTLDVSELRITIANQGTEATPQPTVAIQGRVMRDWQATYATLEQYSRVRDAQRDPVVINAHNEALHGWVMTVLDYLHQLRFRNINFKH